ncbi:hypothetical protein NECAME_02675 [Necator americanus]|uniref:Condensin complex subunit 1 C-terminal domain-containing protein n=1 Tax=Necator americanus TaxID=51031 RepID=W2TCD4_NECAM|nr:hypothetical protein NECAME_02675 [Necator americanus]ETN79249.1 hypothetical protein NECAME_02675 [Necator americanus]
MNMGYIGDSFGQDHLEEMGAAYEENMDRAERAVNVVQEKMLFAEQMTLLFPHVYEALEQSGFTDINYAVTFFATCYRFKIRKAASALYRMYMAGNKNLSTEVLNTVRMLFLKRNIRGDVDIVETANCLMERLNDKEEGDRVAIQDLLYYAFSNTPFPGGLVSHLINIIIKVPPPYKCPAFTALALLTRVDPYGMRKYLRVFHKCVKSEDVREACDALKVITNLIPLQEDDPAKEEENYRFRLRATDSIFHDIESLFLRGFLADDKKHLDDGSLVSDYWYTCARTCIRAIFAIASDVDYLISRILGKVLWHAKRAADVYIAFTRSQENRPIPEGVIVDLIKKENERLCVAWQRTTERALMVVGEVIEGTLFYVDNNFPKLLKRAMELDDNAEEELPDVPEPYADYNKEHTDIEMDFAYREGIFARTITPAKPKTADSSKSEKSEVESERSEPSVNTGNANEPTEDEVEEDESNRKFCPMFQDLGPSTDELIRTRTLELLESRLLRKDGVMGQCLTMVVFFVRTPNVPKAIADAALRAFSKFLLISPQVTERASSLFLTYTCCHPDPDMREYLLVSAVDVMQRFPSMLDRHALFLFDMPIDKDVNVKITALLYLTRMLTRDILKPRGTLSNVALCMLKKRPSNDQSCPVSGSREVIALARKLFYEISLKGNLLVNVMPDLICRVCRWEKEVPLNNFKEIVEILLPLIADKPLDTIVEKMCQRFEFCSSREATAHNQHIAHYFSYFISQIPLSDTSFYKMRDSLPYFATFLEDGIVYHDMIAPVNHLITSTQSVDVKHDAEEFLRKVEFLHVKSTLTDEERDRMSKAVGPINLDVPVKLDKDGNPIIFSFADCDEPVEYDDN